MLDRTVPVAVGWANITQLVVMFFVWKSGSPTRIANFWDNFFVFLLRIPFMQEINGVWKLGIPTRWAFIMKELGLLCHTCMVRLGMVYCEVDQFLCSQFARFNRVFPAPSKGPSESRRVATSPHPQKPTLKKSQPLESENHPHGGKHSSFICVWLLVVFDAWRKLMWERIFPLTEKNGVFICFYICPQSPHTQGEFLKCNYHLRKLFYHITPSTPHYGCCVFDIKHSETTFISINFGAPESLWVCDLNDEVSWPVFGYGTTQLGNCWQLSE